MCECASVQCDVMCDVRRDGKRRKEVLVDAVPGDAVEMQSRWRGVNKRALEVVSMNR